MGSHPEHVREECLVGGSHVGGFLLRKRLLLLLLASKEAHGPLEAFFARALRRGPGVKHDLCAASRPAA